MGSGIGVLVLGLLIELLGVAVYTTNIISIHSINTILALILFVVGNMFVRDS